MVNTQELVGTLMQGGLANSSQGRIEHALGSRGLSRPGGVFEQILGGAVMYLNRAAKAPLVCDERGSAGRLAVLRGSTKGHRSRRSGVMAAAAPYLAEWGRVGSPGAHRGASSRRRCQTPGVQVPPDIRPPDQ